MNVTKGENTSTIQITTKKQQSNSISILNINQGADKLDLKKQTLLILQVQGTKGTYTVKKCIPQQIKMQHLKMPSIMLMEKVSALEAEALSPNDITSVDVKKNGIGTTNSINIITKATWTTSKCARTTYASNTTNF
jgi:hypothetical protein